MSAVLARGLCADLLRLVLSEHTLVCSEVVLAELRTVLSRKARLPLQQIDAIEAFLRDQPVAPQPATILQLGLLAAQRLSGGGHLPGAFRHQPLGYVDALVMVQGLMEGPGA